MNPAELPCTLIDGHTHYHPCFQASDFLDGASANFRLGARQLGVEDAWSGCLLFADTAKQDSLASFVEADRQKRLAPWTLLTTDEEESLICRHDDGAEVFLIAGRQIKAAERLEVLSLCCNARIPDGLPIEQTLQSARDSGAIVILPWGFGKWWHQRGAVIERLIESGNSNLFLGDNAGRLQVGRSPKLLAHGKRNGLRILPGSDPLPFRSQESKAGSYGFVLPGEIDLHRPGQQLRRELLELTEQPRSFGRLSGICSFVRYQFAMQWRKRFGKS